MMNTFNFTLILGGIPEIPAELPHHEFVRWECERMDEMGGRLHAAGCDDSTLGARGSAYFLDFDREAQCLGDAVGSAIEQVERAGFRVAEVRIGEAGAAP